MTPTFSLSVIPAQAGIQTESAWTPAFGVPAKYYFAGGPFAGVTGLVA